MNRKLTNFLLAVGLISLLAGCEKKQISYNMENDRYVESVSGTGLGRLSPVVISFNQESLISLDKAVSLTPAVEGEWKISEDNRTAIFTPAKPYKQNLKLTLKADCKKLFGSEAASRYYEHNFYVSAPSYSVNFDEIRFNETEDSYCLSGNVVTDIPVTEAEVSSVLSAKIGKKAQTVEWTQSSISNRWDFTVKDLALSDHERTLDLKWTGKALGLSSKQDKLYAGKKAIIIPGRSEFSILDVNTSKPNIIVVSFSKALDSAQDIASFITSRDAKGSRAGKITATVRGNILTVFNDANFNGVETVAFEKGIKSSDGLYLSYGSSVRLSDNWEVPEVKFMSDNVILPTSQGSVFPIQTKNLTGVIVQVYQIYDRNMIQFLQSNDLEETYELGRVGEPVYEKTLSWIWNDSMQNTFVSRGLDLSEIARKYPGGMFHVRVSFRKNQIKYVCHANHQDFSNLPMPEDKITPYSTAIKEKSSWDYWEDMDYDQRNSYWRYRSDPCHPAFYMKDYSKNTISKNILVSDLGIIAKRDVNDGLYVTVSDLRTTKPLSGVDVTLKSYVGTTIDTAKTNSEGSAVFKNTGKAYVIIAASGKQNSYLKIGSGTSLSVSHFETGGVIAENGIKGTIYGERGVWRPGDTMYLTFVLQDLEKRLPSNVPLTFELIDPLGRVIDKQMLSKGVNGFYSITTKTGEQDTTGLWTARVRMGGKAWTKYLSVEVIVPNKLSVELENNSPYLQTNSNDFVLKSAWLHGAPAPNYKAEVSVNYSEAATVFDGYGDYSFTNPENALMTSRETVWEGKLDSNSQAKFRLSLDAGRSLPGKLKANFITKVYEPSGGFSTQSKSFDYSPFDRYVGLSIPKGDAARNMLLTDTNHTANVVLLTADGKPVSSGVVSYSMYKLEWKWWWEKDAYTDATHVSSYYRNKLDSGKINIVNGRGSFDFQIKYPDWGRYLIVVEDSQGHSAAKVCYIDWPGWAGRAQEDGSGSASMVPLTTGKKQYKPGETAEVSFSSGKGARALVTIEKSGNIVKQQWIETAEGTTVYRMPVTADMAPNVYVHITLVQPHLQTANSLPIRLYGVVPVNVDDPNTTLKPVITTVQTFEPNSVAKVSVSEASGKPMTYTLAVVDEGLLGLTNYHSPKLRDEFYKKEASRLENWDIYKYVISAYSGKLETILSVGGSEDDINNNARDENRFAPVVKYFGPYTLAAGEKKVTAFDMPNYVGAVRAMVIAGNNGAYGTAEKTVQVKSDLMVQPSIPRTLGAMEKISIPVNVFNCMDRTQNITVKLTGVGANQFNSEKTIQVAAGDSGVVSFDVETKNIGKTTFIAIAKTSSASSKSTTEVNVISRGIPVTYSRDFILKSGKAGDYSVKTPGEKNSTQLKVELSMLPLLKLDNRLNYLTRYPHGCIEQITSGGFPQLYLPGFAKMNTQELEKIKDNVQSVFDRYPNYQTASGAMAYWPGESYPSDWGTCYAVHFMTEAKKKGYAVPDSIYENAVKYLSETAANWMNPGADTTYSGNWQVNLQAYRLFVLALAGKNELGAMNRLYGDVADSGEAKLLLAAAYAQAGRKNIAKDLIKTYRASKGSWRNLSGDFSSNIRESAIYMTACILTENAGDAAKTSKELASILGSDKWLSTQETAWALYALMPYYMSQREAGAAYEMTAGTGKIYSGVIGDVAVVETLRPDYSADQQKATVRNTGKSTLYGTITASGQSIPGTEKSENSGISLRITGLEKTNYKSGDTVSFMVKISNNTSRKIENIALTVPAPTCFEFTNDRLAEGSESRKKASSYTYQDIKDEAIYTYLDLDAGKTETYIFNATVAYTGNFYIPAIHAEAMYDDDLKAVVPGRFVQMIK